MIGYEFEFLITRGKQPLSKKDFYRFHSELGKKGWVHEDDPGTGKLISSSKDGFKVTTDDSVFLFEINIQPVETVIEAQKKLQQVLSQILIILRQQDATIIGTSLFPLPIDFSQDFVCNKALIQYVNPHRFKRNHHLLYTFAAHQLWLDVSFEEVIPTINAINRVSGVIFALFGNSPLFEGKPVRAIEGREILWERAIESDFIFDRKIHGIPERPYADIFEYFDFIFKMPFYFGFRDGIPFYLVGPKITYGDFFKSNTTQALMYPGKQVTVRPQLNDFDELQRVTFPYARFKYHIKKGVSLEQILETLEQRDGDLFKQCFDQVFVECRAIPAQRQGELSVAPAFLVGLQKNFRELIRLLDEYPYNFWQTFKDVTIHTGLNGTVDGKPISQVIQPFIEAATIGLRARGFDEEQFLDILDDRLLKKENPGQEMLELFNISGMDRVIQKISFV